MYVKIFPTILFEAAKNWSLEHFGELESWKRVYAAFFTNKIDIFRSKEKCLSLSSRIVCFPRFK